MTRISLLPSVLLALALWFFSSCQKDKTTTLRGKVVDKVTGAALDSVKLDIVEYEKSTVPPFNNINQKVNVVYTDASGFFEFSSSDLDVGLSQASKPGYVPKNAKFPRIEKGMSNDISFAMVPRDGILKLLINNTSDRDTIYVGIFCPSWANESPITAGYAVGLKILAYSMTSVSYSPLALPADELISVYWDLTPWTTSYSITQFPNSGSLFLTRGDTHTTGHF